MSKKITACALSVAMLGLSSVAMAHTGVRDQGTEGKTLYTAFTIGHGCEGNTVGVDDDPVPVIAQAVAFPVGQYDLAYKIDPVSQAETRINLANFIEGAVGGIAALKPTGVQDKNVFQNAKTVQDGTGLNRAFRFTNGNLDTSMIGAIPFRVSGVKFIPTTCAKSLKVRFAIANWCNTSQTDTRRVDLWMGYSTTTKFNDPAVVGTSGGKPYWPTLTINRDLVTNPLPAGCPTYTLPDGKKVQGVDIAVQPAPGAVDNWLPIKGFWPTP